jgi:hypothetical protein
VPNARHGLAACGERVARTATQGLHGAWNVQCNGGPDYDSRGATHAFAEVLPLSLRAIPNRRSRARDSGLQLQGWDAPEYERGR